MKLKDLTLIEWLGIILVINGVLDGSINEMTDLIGSVWAKHIVSITSMGSAIVGGLVTMFGGLGTQAKNVVAAGGQINVSPQAASALTTLAADVRQPAIQPATVAKILIAAFALSFLLAGGGSAMAQTTKPRFVPTGDIPGDIRRAVQPSVDPNATTTPTGVALGDSGCHATGQPIADLHCVIKAGGAKLILHLKQSYALASAAGINGGTADNTSAMCTKALVPVFELVINGPKSTDLAAGDPMALTDAEKTLAATPNEPDGPIVVVEKIRILRLALQSPALNDACGALVQDEVKNAQNLIGKVTGLITGAGLMGIGIP